MPRSREKRAGVVSTGFRNAAKAADGRANNDRDVAENRALKEQVRSVMKKRCAKLEKRYGEVPANKVKLLVSCNAILNLVKEILPVQQRRVLSADIAWAWVP